MQNRQSAIVLWASLVTLPLMAACGGQNESDDADAALTSGLTEGQGEQTAKISADLDEPFTGQVQYCHDGDTCTIKVAGRTKPLTVRLIGIDAPEVSGGEGNRGQPLGMDAREHLNGLVKGKEVGVLSVALDMYGRSLAELSLGKQKINVAMLKAGYAQVYGRDKRVDGEAYKAAQASAKAKSLGIWSLADYEAPDAFRRRMKAER